ncbi:hypothetical protein [Streptomyces sp. CRN 30]|uniref:hypothetical protein n=1 Tax=Streptomyces sp. CRN 30 TaxID=3075613 RepID=UPI002A8357D4|nr:hypothetical protein [Streptomyces sp. CRN 30]
MRHRIARLTEPLLRLLLPARGRHRRAVGQPLAPYVPDTPTTRQAGSRPLRGEDNHLVRPYLVAHERCEEARRRRTRRRTLLLAVHGVEVAL